MTGKVTKLEWDLIEARAKQAMVAHQLKSISIGLLWVALSQYFPGHEDEFLECITDGPDDRGVDAIRIVESDDTARVYIFQSKARENIAGSIKTINGDEALKLCHFLTSVFEVSDDLKGCGNLRLREAVMQIWELHRRGIICWYEIVFVSNDAGLNPAARAILEGFSDQHEQVAFAAYGAKDIIRDIGAPRRQVENGSLQVIGKEIFERTDGDVRGLVASVDANSLIDLITSTESGTVKKHIFDDNLRVFLGANSGYNSNIIGTATSDEGYLFWYLNNGITITCKNFSFNKSHANPVINLENFQIVNGAQTSHSLVEARRRNSVALEDVVVSIRVYATDRLDIAERVAVATNSQARIQGRDLRANAAVLKKMESAFLERGYFFERKKNMFADRDPEKRIDALKLGQIILSFYLMDPDKARTESDTIFDGRFHQVYHEEMDIDELIKVCDIYSKIEWLRDDFESRFGNQIENSGDYQYLIYGHWFILFAAAIILRKDGRPVPEGEDAGRLVEDAITIVARACNQQKQVAHYQMFRSPRTKEKIISEISGKQLELFAHLFT